jgi:hypothetical protein
MSASVRTRRVRADAVLRPWTVKTRPWVKPCPRGKCGRGRMSGGNGRLDGNFYHRTSVMATLHAAHFWCAW